MVNFIFPTQALLIRPYILHLEGLRVNIVEGKTLVGFYFYRILLLKNSENFIFHTLARLASHL